MLNFRLLFEIENEETEDELACQQNDDEKDDQDDANCEQWAQGEESPPLVTFQPNWTQPNNPSYTSFDNHEPH